MNTLYVKQMKAFMEVTKWFDGLALNCGLMSKDGIHRILIIAAISLDPFLLESTSNDF